MNFKRFLHSNFAFVIYMLLAAVAVGFIIYTLVFLWLGKYTEHGQEQTVPNISGMYIEEARIVLAQNNLKLEVIDSTYTNRVPLGAIVEQNPSEGSKVKNDRAIYVIMNARTKKQVPMPNLRDMSYRQAESTLRALGIEVLRTRYEPSEFRDLILDVQSADGVSIEAGTRLSEDDKVILVVGQGKGTEQVYVPNLRGNTLTEARANLLAARLIVGAINYDKEPNDTDSLFVYHQQPEAGKWIIEGSHIDLYLTTDIEEALKTLHTEDDEDFF